MLKRLELIGFKSFAEKTAFDFAAGITAVVGPNGSGKSNVVDAVKWVLGEQSAKSLRSGEMADVIFNGSTTRKGLGLAEVTLTFDNARGLLAAEGTEVRVGRRVYRDGQGEYLLNGQPCRLKDIKDLFLGTGAGAGAYSIIEQGRVDALLQSSQDDRRAVFEEAAGISRFKARKLECLRRLERVGSNLDRLHDILSEVDGQLRGVRLQAAKAQRYQEYADRLKFLRVAVGRREYEALSGQLFEVESTLSTARQHLAAAVAEAAARDGAARELDAAIDAAAAEARSVEAGVANAKARRVAAEADARHADARAAQLHADRARADHRRAELARRRAELESAAAAAAAAVADAVAVCTEEDRAAAEADERQRDLAAATAAIRADLHTAQAEHLERLREAARWQNEATSAGAQAEQLQREHARLAAKTEHAAGQLAAVDTQIQALQAAEAAQDERLQQLRGQHAARCAERDAARDDIDALRRELADARNDAAGLASRIDLLDDLARSREGLSAGTREVLAELADPASELSASVIGLVADLLATSHDDAPVIDVALGSIAHAFVVRDPARLVDYLIARPQPLPGRTGFVAVDRPAPARPAVLLHIPGVIAAASLVGSELPDLPRRLLGDTLVVPDLATARRLAGRLPGWRFVTRACEVLEADGTLTAGEHRAEAGLLARKSELIELRTQAALLADHIDAREFDLGRLGDAADTLEAQVVALNDELTAAAEGLADLRSQIARHREQRANLSDELRLSQAELGGLAAETARHDALAADARAHAASAAEAARAAQARQQDLERKISRSDQQRVRLEQAHTAAQVALARARERVDSSSAAERQLADQLAALALDATDVEQGLALLDGEIAACHDARQSAEAELAAAAATLTAAESELSAVNHRREGLVAERRQLHEQHQAAADAWARQRDDAHACELKANELRHRRDALAARLADDYAVDLANSDQPADLGGLTPEAALAEIDTLRGKLARLGSVNLEALDELNHVELKAQHLRVQLDDLTNARRSLEEIIDAINLDSRRLFTDTFAAIRVHFQDLFRRLFGGGLADIVLENPDDPLESAIDVVARPPGKELRSIALMSGGERTMTAVALLLAIFRSKPSPFCLLDEVDAALDEANTARLTAVLREFAAESQFIVITHAKRTMAAADVLYGITMQESGVSKRVAVRFEDWPDEARRAA